jgi:hypothetical protein
MRLFVVGLLTMSLAAAGCNRSEGTPEPEENAPASRSPRTGSPAAAAVSEPSAPVWHEVTIPAGTAMSIVLDTPIASDTSRLEDPVRAHLADPISVDGSLVVPANSAVFGVVTAATRSARVKGRAHVSLRFDTLVPADQEERYEIMTHPVERTAAATKKEDALKVAAPAAGGAIVGGLVGGGKGAAIGTAVGGGAGTAVVLSTRGDEVRLARGATMTVKLAKPLTVRVRA